MTPILLLGLSAGLVPLAWWLGQSWGRNAGWALSGGFAVVAALLSWSWLDRTTPALIQSRPWVESLGLSWDLRLDGLGFLFAVIVFGVGALVMAYAVNYLPKQGRHGLFYALLTFFATAMLGLVLADNLILLWIFWEFTTLCSFLLIQQSGPKAKGPATRTLVVTAGGGLCLLAAVILTASVTGTTNLTEALAGSVWTQRPGITATVAVLVAVAAFTKCAQFPFHGWLPDAMVASTPVSAYLHAAAMVKAGIYLLTRFSTAFHDVPTWNALLIVIGLCTAVMGALYALQRFDLKEMLAYSTISQLGLLVATLGLGTRYALIGACVHVVAHAVFKSALFMAVGLIDHETGTRDLRKLSALRTSMPWTSLVLALAAVSMAGLPPMLGFVSKEAIFKAMTLSSYAVGVTVAICTAAVACAIGTVAYSARMLRPLFGTPMANPPHEAPTLMIVPVGIGAVAGLLLGLAGPVLEPLINGAAAAVLTGSSQADLSLWHGLNPALAMSVTAIALGAVAVLARHRIDHLIVGRRLGWGSAVGAVEGFREGAIALGGRVSRVTESDAPRRHLIVPLVVLVVVVATVTVSLGVTWPAADTTRRLDWLLTGLVAFGVLLTLRASSRVALVTTVGIVGFATALIFFNLGAPDVAITQLLVEILTVAVMVLLLVRLPVLFHVTTTWRTVGAAALAMVVGTTAWLVALSAQSSVTISDVGRTYLAQAYALSGGTNVVNTILVDFRAFDTLGEMVVLGVAALSMAVALDARGLLPHQPSPYRISAANPAYSPVDNTIALRVADRLIGPILLGLSVWFFLRGHYHPGGGFIGALVAGAALTLIFLAASDDAVARLRINYLVLIGVGVVLAVAMGLVGYVDGSFLRPLYGSAFGVAVSTGLLFDVGVYLTVLGLILGALARLGLDGPDAAPVRVPSELTARTEVDHPEEADL